MLVWFFLSLCRLVNGVQGITWRLGFGLDNPKEPEGKRPPSLYLLIVPWAISAIPDP